MRALEEWFAELQEAFKGLDIDVVAIGAFAALRYRDTTRVTVDLDVLVSRIDRVCEVLQQRGFAVEEIGNNTGEQPFLVIAEKDGFRIDIMLAETAYQECALKRANEGVLRVEDVIIHKLIAWRVRDRDDIASILRAGHPLDIDYIERWADEWEVTQRWQEMFSAQ